MDILAPISHGELIDKITILRIKAKRITDPGKLVNIFRELSMLETLWKRHVPPVSSVLIHPEETELLAVNESIWDVVEAIHKCEAERKFDQSFMELAHRVCVENDRRAEIKKRINKILGSGLIEEKSHQ